MKLEHLGRGGSLRVDGTNLEAHGTAENSYPGRKRWRNGTLQR